MEGAIHHFDAWRDLTGADFKSVSVQSPVAGGPVSMSATMSAAPSANNQGAIVVGAVFSEYAGDNSEIRVMGRDGTITLSLYRYNGFDYCPALVSHGSARQHARKVAESIRSLPAGLRTLDAGEYGHTFELQLEAFLDAIRSDGDAAISLEDGAAATAAALAAIRSIDTQKRVGLDSIF
jgi:predicted dehydrogenase